MGAGSGLLHARVPQGAVTPSGVQLADDAGRPVAVQLSEVEWWPGEKSVRKAAVSFMVTLAPNEERHWTLTAGRNPVKPVATDLKATIDYRSGAIEIETARTGIRLAGGTKTFAEPVDPKGLPAPIQAVRLHDGPWIGKGWWQTDVKCTGYSARIAEQGPVFVRSKLRYEFEGGRFYAATVELTSGQDLAVVSEEYNLSEGKRYPMSGVSGMKPDVRYAYVYPKFASPDRALIWDWWGQTNAKLPIANAYVFSFGEGLRPDSADFRGYNKYRSLAAGDGGLKYDADGRFAYVNAFPQWGDEETPYLGFYNSKTPSRQLAVVALRPSGWLHPDVDPHPDATLQQYTQTTCLTFERRRSGEVFFRAAVDLGKRVYGIGGVRARWPGTCSRSAGARS